MGRNAAANAPLVTSAGRDHVLLSKQLGIVVGGFAACVSIPSDSFAGAPFVVFPAARLTQDPDNAVIVISCGLLLFVQSQQAAVQKAMLNSEHVKQQNQMLTKKNEDIAAAKKQLEADEDEYVARLVKPLRALCAKWRCSEAGCRGESDARLAGRWLPASHQGWVASGHRLTKMYEKWIADDKEDLKLTKEAIAEYRAKVDAVQKSQESNSQVLAHKEVMLSMKEDVLSVSALAYLLRRVTHRALAPRPAPVRLHGRHCRPLQCPCYLRLADARWTSLARAFVLCDRKGPAHAIACQKLPDQEDEEANNIPWGKPSGKNATEGRR